MKKTLLLAVLAVLAIGNNGAMAQVVIDMVNIGNAGNAADSNTYGSVAYNYSIGKYDVTIGQYTAFLNAVAATDTYGLYSSSMGSNSAVGGITQSGSSGNYTYSVRSVGAFGSTANVTITYVSGSVRRGSRTGWRTGSQRERRRARRRRTELTRSSGRRAGWGSRRTR